MRLIDVRLQGNRAGVSRIARARDHRPLANAVRDFLSELLSVGAALRVLGFGRISQKTALDQDSGDLGVTENIKTPAPHATIG